MKKETLKTKVEITKETKSFDVSLSNQLIERPKVTKKVEYKVNYSETIASIKEVDISYQMKKGYFKAVNNVSFDIHKSEILGLIGESGSGKSTIGRAISGITSYTSGSIEVNGVVMPHNNLNINKEQKKYRIKSSQYIFQDPSASLNPNKTIEKAINDVYRDNFKYKDTLSNAWNKRFDEFVGQEFFEKLFRQPFGLYNKNIKSFNENNVLIKNEEDLMRDYFIQLSNTYINYKTDTS
ncbi:MAG: ATP-binding cassette domain-containing protein, partial [Mycoplasmataceae bacterium]|nr:ATP-binding cassette domain-containing protein [Mycoplasmataceae bacterium]